MSRAVASTVVLLSRRSASLPPPTQLTSTHLPPIGGSRSLPSLLRPRGRATTRPTLIDKTSCHLQIRPIQLTAVLEEQDQAYRQLLASREDSQREWNRRMPVDHLVVYTDGSYKDGRSGFGIYLGPGHKLNRSVSITAPPHNSQRPEILAILLALKNILGWAEYSDQPVILRTDALFAVQAVSGQATLPAYQQEIQQIRGLSSQLGGSVHFQHVYAHVGDPGNEAADELARQAVLVGNREGRSRSKTRDRSREWGRSRSRDNDKEHIRTHSTNITGSSSAA